MINLNGLVVADVVVGYCKQERTTSFVPPVRIPQAPATREGQLEFLDALEQLIAATLAAGVIAANPTGYRATEAGTPESAVALAREIYAVMKAPKPSCDATDSAT